MSPEPVYRRRADTLNPLQIFHRTKHLFSARIDDPPGESRADSGESRQLFG